jgi:hypothetical protein
LDTSLITRQDQAFKFEKQYDYLIGILPMFYIWTLRKKTHFSITFRKRCNILNLCTFFTISEPGEPRAPPLRCYFRSPPKSPPNYVCTHNQPTIKNKQSLAPQKEIGRQSCIHRDSASDTAGCVFELLKSGGTTASLSQPVTSNQFPTRRRVQVLGMKKPIQLRRID